MTDLHENAYWNRKGPEQAKYDEMEAAGFEYTPRTQEVFHRYYRFHNDGDATPRIRSLMSNLSYARLQSHPEYIAYCRRHEEKVTERIRIEYRRFQKERHTASESNPA